MRVRRNRDGLERLPPWVVVLSIVGIVSILVGLALATLHLWFARRVTLPGDALVYFFALLSLGFGSSAIERWYRIDARAAQVAALRATDRRRWNGRVWVALSALMLGPPAFMMIVLALQQHGTVSAAHTVLTGSTAFFITAGSLMLNILTMATGDLRDSASLGALYRALGENADGERRHVAP